MLGYFPKPFHNELLYSVLARYCVHMGINSPKEALDDLYGNRKVVAVADLPGHIHQLLKHVGYLWHISPSNVIYEHTLFPLYGPFISNHKRNQVISSMTSNLSNTVHTRVGLAASVIKPPEYLRYCPLCNLESQRTVGEYYWNRLFQITGVTVCPKHYCGLLSSSIRLRNEHRHHFIAASPNNCTATYSEYKNSVISKKEELLAAKIGDLLSLSSLVSPGYVQWTQFYYDLAAANDCKHATHVDHQGLKQRFLAMWANTWLAANHIMITDEETCWFRGLFRKHRKSFSYLQHLLVWQALCPQKSVSEILNQVNRYQNHSTSSVGYKPIATPVLQIVKCRQKWLQQLDHYKNMGSNFIRKKERNAALYAWLYRHDRKWLITINQGAKRIEVCRKARVDWHRRDLIFVRLLIKRYEANVVNLFAPRRTHSWFTQELRHKASFEKNLHRLPLCETFLNRYSESISKYQIRRCIAFANRLDLQQDSIKRWEIERLAGLSQERVTPKTELFLQRIEEYQNGENRFQTNTG